jgi:hypothetical protein
VFLPYKISHDAESNCIRTRIDGELDMNLIKNLANDLRDVAFHNDYKYYLNDIRKAEVKLTLWDIYELPNLTSSALPSNYRAALIVRSESDLSRFYENVSKNFNQSIRVFTDIQAAERWLFDDQLVK